MQRMLKIKKTDTGFGQKRGRRPKSLVPNNASRVLTQPPRQGGDFSKPVKLRGRPPGSKNKPRPLPTDEGVATSEAGRLAGAGKDAVRKDSSLPALGLVQRRTSQFDVPRSINGHDDSLQNELKSRTVWKLPDKSKLLLDKVCITDVTANAFTVTVRESSTQDGFFRSQDETGGGSNVNNNVPC